MFPRRVGILLLIAAALLRSAGASHAAPGDAPGASPSRAASARCDQAQFRVVLDVGHTAEDPGAMSARGVPEYEFNLRLAKRIEQNLIESGFGRTVLLVTAGPAQPGLASRVAHANAIAADLFLSIHHDSVPDAFLKIWDFDGKENHYSDQFAGHSIFVSYDNPDRAGSLLFAKLLGKQLKARDLRYTPHYTEKLMGHRQRELLDAEAGVYRYDQLIVLRTTRMPAVLLEAGLIINRDEELQLGTEQRQSRIVAAVTDAVEQFCAARSPRNPDRIASSSRAANSPAAASPPAVVGSRGALPAGLVYLRHIDPTIVQDIRYAGSNNFVGAPLAGYDAAECILTRDAAAALQQVQADLAGRGLALKVYDCYRPERAVHMMEQWANDGSDSGATKRFYPRLEKSNLFAGYIAARSRHSTGTAVDLTLIEASRSPAAAFDPAASYAACTAPASARAPDDSVDMGTGFDCLDANSHTASPATNADQRRWRNALVAAMQKRGFKNYYREWWHFEFGPAPASYYDVPIRSPATPDQ